MEGARIAKAKEALVLFIQSLPLSSRFNVISFGSNYKQLHNSSVENTNAAVRDAVKAIKGMKADLGGTYILEVLKQQL